MGAERIALVFLLTAMAGCFEGVSAVPVSPCPQNFHYEYDGYQWIGVMDLPHSVYRGIGPNKITTVIVLVVAGQVPDSQNFGSLDLFQPPAETYQSIAAQQSIKYRVSFPARSLTPTLLEISVNNVRVCTNRLHQPSIYTAFTRIQLQHSFALVAPHDSGSPTPALEGPVLPDYHRVFKQPEVVSPLVQEKVEENEQSMPEEDLFTLEESVPVPAETQCGRIDDQFRLTHLVSGGKRVARGTWPWIVGIYVKAPNGVTFQCTGNMLSHRAVLTAAHCIRLYSKRNQYGPGELLLAFGQHNLRDWSEKDVVLSDVERIIVHPEYLKEGLMNSYDADIALLVTRRFISYGAMIKPVCLWPAETTSIEDGKDIVGLVGTLVGWGQPSENPTENHLRKLGMQVVAKNVCFPSARSRNRSEARKRVFCARTTSDSGPCSGDSGSGFAMSQNGAWFLRGIVSAAVGDPILNRCELNTFIIFTDIIKFRPWIDSVLLQTF